MEKMDENYIRRERRRKQETKRTVAEMRAALKVCNMDDVRRHKLPFDRALIIGLEEKGYFVTATFMQQLIDFQTDLREKAGAANFLWSKPQLKDNKNLLKTISDSLMKAENYCKAEDHTRECEAFLKIATHVAFLHPDWWWLGEQLLLQSISTSKDYPALEGKFEALGRYVYAKFLLENFKEVETAHDNLVIVRELSKGKKWITCDLISEEKDYLYTKANYLLHVCLMQEAKTYVKTDFRKAIRIATEARKRAAEACHLDGETKALLLKGICELSIRANTAAIASFMKAFYIQDRVGNLEGVCTTQLHLAQAYMANGDTLQSLKTLMASKNCAEDNNLNYFLAQAYKHLGEFYLNNGEPRKATPLLGESLKILYKTDNPRDAEQVRNLEAISAGLELFPRYIKLLNDTAHPETGFESLMKMVDWKDTRKQFWSQDDEFDIPSPVVACEDDSEETILSTYDVANRFKDDIVEIHDNIDAFKQESNAEEEQSEGVLITEKDSIAAKEDLVQVINEEPSDTIKESE